MVSEIKVHHFLAYREIYQDPSIPPACPLADVHARVTVRLSFFIEDMRAPRNEMIADIQSKASIQAIQP